MGLMPERESCVQRISYVRKKINCQASWHPGSSAGWVKGFSRLQMHLKFLRQNGGGLFP